MDAPGSLLRADPDRYLATLFAPVQHRATLTTLYLFNHELARAREAVSEPTLALIRLQWWREVAEGAKRAHEVATPLAAALGAGDLHAGDLLAMIEAREQEAEGEIPTLAAWLDWLRLGAGSVAVASGRALGTPEAMLPRLRALGAGYGAAGILRSIPAMARQQRCLLPLDVLEAAGLTPHEVISDPASAALAPVRHRLAAEGSALLGRARTMPRAIIAAALPAVLARRDLARQGQGELRGLGDRLAVTNAALLRRA
jgi:phytoene synthase